MSYLFFPHAIFWVVLLLYVYDLIGKNQNLRIELESIKASKNPQDEKVIWQKQEAHS